MFLLNKYFMAPFYGWGSTVSKLQSHYEEIVYLLPFSSKEVLVLNWLAYFTKIQLWNLYFYLSLPTFL